MAEPVDYKGRPTSAVAAVSAFHQSPPNPLEADALRTVSHSPKPTAVADEMTDEDRCLQILSAFGLDPSVAAASAPVDTDSTDPAPPSPPLGADLVRPAPPAPRHQVGVDIALSHPSPTLGRPAPPAPRHQVGVAIVLAPASPPLGADLVRPAPSAPLHQADVAWTNLPPDILLDIACRLGPPRLNVQAMRSTCPAWRAIIPSTSGPLLLMSRLDNALPAGMQKLLGLQLAALEGGATSLVPCNFFYRPPAHNALWGAAHGLLALNHQGTRVAALFCPNCGRHMLRLPQFPRGYTTKRGGLFFNSHPNQATRFAILSNKQCPFLFIERPWGSTAVWELYPRAESTRMMSLCFLNDTHFVGISKSTVVVGPVSVLYHGRRNPFQMPSEDLVFLDLPTVGGPVMVAWGHYGNHVFSCDSRVYVCVMLRSTSNDDAVGTTVYSLDQLPGGGYSLISTKDIGPFAVYLGANQALVLPAAGSMSQRANTIYIEDDDGVISSPRVMAINIGSGEVESIPFPSDVSLDDYGRSTWVALPPVNMPFWHCNTQMRF